MGFDFKMSEKQEELIYGVDFGGKNCSICCYKNGDGYKVLENDSFSRRNPYC